MSLPSNSLRYTVDRLIADVKKLPTNQQLSAVEALVHHRDPETRTHSHNVAHAINHPQTTLFCMTLLEDPLWYVRCAACESIFVANIAVPASQLLYLVENDPEESVRYYAALALVKVAGEGDIPELLRLAESVSGTNHEGTTVREVLLQAIDEIRRRVKK